MIELICDKCGLTTEFPKIWDIIESCKGIGFQDYVISNDKSIFLCPSCIAGADIISAKLADEYRANRKKQLEEWVRR